MRRLIVCFGGKLLLVNWERIKGWAERGRSRMRTPIRWHVTSGNVSREVPVGLYVSVKSVGVCDVMILKDDALSRLFAGRRRHRACGTQSAVVQLVFYVIGTAAAVTDFAIDLDGVRQNTIYMASSGTYGDLRS